MAKEQKIELKIPRRVYKYGKEHPRWKGGKITKFCEFCNKRIEVFPCKIGRFCSRKCTARGTIRVGEKHRLWKGEKAKYGTLHDWVEQWRGKPNVCEFCGKVENNGRMINWANKSQKYKRELSDWIRLCVPCHKNYDRNYSGVW